MAHDIDFGKIKQYMARQEWMHSELQKIYQSYGLVYAGRTRYVDNAWNNTATQNNSFYGKHQKVTGSHQINGIDQGAGYRGNYEKLNAITKKIHQDFLKQIYSQLLNVTNKHILDKFSEDSGIQGDPFNKVIGITTELAYDVENVKKWVEEAQKVLWDSEKELSKLAKENEELAKQIRMQTLVNVGKAILGRSTELCPIETGRLRESGKLYAYDDYIKIIYECEYAGYVHENVNAVHPFGQAKFLETAAQEILQDKSVWIQNEWVQGSYMSLMWNRDESGRARGDAVAFTEHNWYFTIFMTIDTNFNLNTRS